MKWTETRLVKHLCMTVLCIFFSQSVQPVAFGFQPVQPVASVPSKGQAFSQRLLKSRLQHQVSYMIDKVKGQLQELEMLPDIEKLTKKQGTDELSCAASEMSELASTKSFNPHPNLLPSREKERMKNERKEKSEEGGGNWFDWLSSLLVSEAHAQTPDPNLASTPDANTTDQFIVEKAQELGNDPNAIFTFMRDEVGYESYRGSLRGARGTLWSKGGNALDQASLLIALLRASGVPARYVQGTLSDPLAQELILSMFPNPTRVVGCPPP